MGKICEQFEAETPTDSEATRKARFELVLDLMQQVRPPLAVCPLVLSVWVLGGGGIWEECPTAKPRWKREQKRGPVAGSPEDRRETVAQILLWAVTLVPRIFSFSSSSYFLATGFGPSSKRTGWRDGEYIFS